MARIIKRGSKTEGTAETIDYVRFSCPKETGPWFIAEFELDPSIPDRPSSGGVSYNKATVGNLYEAPTAIGLSQEGAISSVDMRRSVADNMETIGPTVWRGLEPMQLRGEDYHGWVAVKSGSQATPATQSVSYRVVCVNAEELK